MKRITTHRWVSRCEATLIASLVVASVACCDASIYNIARHHFGRQPWGTVGMMRPSTVSLSEVSSLVRSDNDRVRTLAHFPRGGAKDEEDDEEEYDDEYDEEEYDEEYDEEDEEEEDEKEPSTASNGPSDEVIEYDAPLAASPMMNLYATIGVMFLAKRIDLFDPIVVKCARALFVGYLLVQQLFLVYVRIQAKLLNNQTMVTIKNPLSSVLQKQLGGDGGNGGGAGMMKNLASSFLSSESTIKDYDLKQARSMQSGLVMNMLFMWFLHFKMEQVQPLIIQSATGMLQLFYSPLFQIYVLGRNLERPFVNSAMARMEEAAAATTAAAADSIEDDTEDAASILEQESKDAVAEPAKQIASDDLQAVDSSDEEDASDASDEYVSAKEEESSDEEREESTEEDSANDDKAAESEANEETDNDNEEDDDHTSDSDDDES